MKFYLLTIEQIFGEGEKPTEYAKVEKFNTLTEAEVEFYKKLMNVTNALGKTHTYMNIKVVNSFGVVANGDEKTIGAYFTEETVEGE